MNRKLLNLECCFGEFEPRRLALKFEPACARHHIGDFGDKSTKSETTNIAGTDEALVQTGKGNVAPGSVVVSEGNYLSPDSVQINAGGRLNTGVDLANVSGGVTFQSLSDDVANAAIKAVSDAGKSYTDTLSALVQQNTQAVSDKDEKFSGVVKDVLGELSKLSESKQTDGDSERNKNIVLIVLGVLALLGVIFYRR